MSDKNTEYEITTEYINLMTDFGFKHVFGSLAHKRVLVRFLNAIFEGKLTVTDITYHDKEILPADEKGKRIVYDVYCTSPIQRDESSYFPDYQLKGENGKLKAEHHFILEMQNAYSPPFEERITYYACKMVSEQGMAGWDYTLAPVLAVAVTNFNFDHLTPKLVRDVMLADRESGEALTDKVHVILCSLKEVPKEWTDCRTELERIMFLIKNIDKMDSTSLAYTEGRYPEIFEAAKSNRLKDSDIILYSQSLAKLREDQRMIEYAVDKAKKDAMEKGLAEGREKGLAEGRAEANCQTARRMLEMGMNIELISTLTGLSPEEIESI